MKTKLALKDYIEMIEKYKCENINETEDSLTIKFKKDNS